MKQVGPGSSIAAHPSTTTPAAGDETLVVASGVPKRATLLNIVKAVLASFGVTTNYLPKWAENGFTNSRIRDDGDVITLGDGSENAGAVFDNNPSSRISVIGDVFGNGNGTKIEVSDNSLVITLNAISIIINANVDVSGSSIIAGEVSVTDDAYDATAWNGSSDVPTKNAIRDKIETIRPYKVYVALLTQSGPEAPVVTELENTLGASVNWTRTATGRYSATAIGVFTVGKTVVFVQPPPGASLTNKTYVVSVNANSSADSIGLITQLIAAQLGSHQVADGALAGTAIEIRVYP